jgi:hypothetical protein
MFLFLADPAQCDAAAALYCTRTLDSASLLIYRSSTCQGRSYCMRLESASWTASGQLESHHPIHPSALHEAVDCGLDNQPIPSHHYIAAKIIHRVQRETLSFAIIHVSPCRCRLTFAPGVLAVIGSLATLSDAIPAC